MTRLLRTLLAVTALLSVATVAHAAPSSGLPTGPVGSVVMVGDPTTSDVMIVGDSITVRGYKDLAAALPGKLAVNAQSGRNTRLSIDSLFAQLQAGAKLPPELIMATGANDIFRPLDMAPQVQRLLALVAAKSPTTEVYWVDASVRRPGYVLADNFNSAVVNQGIRKYCVGSCMVISWAGFLAAKSSRRAMYIDSGGVHPIIGVGTKTWAALIAGSVKGAAL